MHGIVGFRRALRRGSYRRRRYGCQLRKDGPLSSTFHNHIQNSDGIVFICLDFQGYSRIINVGADVAVTFSGDHADFQFLEASIKEKRCVIMISTAI